MLERLLCILLGYVCGLFQTGYLYGKLNHIDIRKHGSGNAGTTNALRTLGLKAGAITFIGDCLKCVLAVVLVRLIFASYESVELYAFYAGMGAVLGHNYPFYLKFQGGKGIASTAGLVLAVNPTMFVTIAIVFLVILLTTKYVSLGSIAIMILFVTEIIIYGQMGGFSLSGVELIEFYAIAVFLAAMACWRHRANVKRLLNGTENQIDLLKMLKKK